MTASTAVPTTAPYIRRLTRCGCCDVLTNYITCGQCGEPACERHVERVVDIKCGDLRWLCTLCAHEQVEAGLAVHVNVGRGTLAAWRALAAGDLLHTEAAADPDGLAPS